MVETFGTVDMAGAGFAPATEGEDVDFGTPKWVGFVPPIGSVMEVSCFESSIFGNREDWFALLVRDIDATAGGGVMVTGAYLGCEATDLIPEHQELLSAGKVHLCGEDPCAIGDQECFHGHHVRGWNAKTFTADYLTPMGRKTLKDYVTVKDKEDKRLEKEREKEGKKKQKEAGKLEAAAKSKAKETVARSSRPKGRGAGIAPPTRGRGAGVAPPAKERAGILKPATRVARKRKEPTVIEIASEEEEEPPENHGEEEMEESKAGLQKLRGILAATKQRILGTGGAVKRRRGEGDANDGRDIVASPSAVEGPRLVAGTNMKPGHYPLVALPNEPGTNDGTLSRLTKKLKRKNDSDSALLAQALQSAQKSTGEGSRKRKKKKKGSIETLVELLKKGEKKEKKSKKEKKKRKLKPDPDDPGDGEDGSSGEEESEDETEDEAGASETDSDLELEAPLRKKAAKEPGSVMKLLIKHAQEQMDRGSLMDHEGDKASVTSGIKISTYFALLIRPYYNNNSPLLRELYAMAQTIDLLRGGRLAETADALASRFISVHTALAEGNWQVASTLELFPLEPVQSAGTSTMLAAQRHRKLIWKSQGYSYPSGGGWWNQSGRGKGKQGGEKGKKGDGKQKGKGKGKGSGKDNQWQASKGENQWKDNKEDPGKKAT